MMRLTLATLALAAVAVGCNCGSFNPVTDCDGVPCEDGGAGGGSGGGTGGGTGGGDEDAGDVDAGDVDAGDVDAGDVDAGDVDGGTGGGTGTDGGTGGGTGTDGGVFDYCTDLATKRCDFAIRCVTDSNDDLSQNRTNDRVAPAQRATCIASEMQECQVGQAAFAKGRFTYDAARYAACAAALYPASTCVRDVLQAQAACDLTQMLTANVASGGLCTSDFECQRGFCSVPNGQLCGVCQAFTNVDGGAGTPCVRDAMCSPATSYCPGADGTQARQCQVFKAAAAGCNGSILESGQQEECGPTSVCQGSFTGGGFSCAVGKAAGAACAKGRFECLRPKTGQFGLTCATVGPGSDLCVRQFNTTAGGTCGTGENWFGTSQGPFCREDEFCSANVCVPRRVASQPCTSNDQCTSGTRCERNGANGFCVPFKDITVACGNSGECLNLLTCRNNTCQATFSVIGGSCTNQGAGPGCADGFCDAAGANQGTCQARKADGAACANANECGSFACVGMVCAAACWR